MSHIGNGAPGGIYCGVDGALETVGRYCSENDHASESAVISHSVAPRRAALRFPAMSHMSPSFVALVIYARRRKRRQLNISALKLLPTQCHIDGTRDTSTLQIIGYQIR